MAQVQTTTATQIAAPKSKDPAAHLTAPLVRVRMSTDFALHFPDKVEEPTGKFDENTRRPIMKTLFVFGEDTYRGGPGYVVDWTQPLERVWCKGQEHKLENVPEDELASTSASPLGHPQAIIAMQRPKVEAAKQSVAELQARAEAARKSSGATPVKRFAEKEG